MMDYCYGYIGVSCVDGTCPVARAEEEGYFMQMKCDDCFYYRGCEDCAAPYYKCCPEGKEGE